MNQPPQTKPRPEISLPKPFEPLVATKSVTHSKAIETGTDFEPLVATKSVPHSKTIDELKESINEKVNELQKKNIKQKTHG
jgi:hypothetical protein